MTKDPAATIPPVMLSSTVVTGTSKITATFDRDLRQADLNRGLWTIHDGVQPWTLTALDSISGAVVTFSGLAGIAAVDTPVVTYAPGNTPDIASAKGAYQYATQTTTPAVS